MSTFDSLCCNQQNFMEDRLSINYLLDQTVVEQDDIKELINRLQNTPRSIPARYFYDRQGSQLFEQICQLPEYYPTRTEARILATYAAEIILQTQAVELVELGSGSSTKTRYLLDPYLDLDHPLYYTPIDVSESILEFSSRELLEDYPQLKINALVATYNQALSHLSNYSLGKRLIIFLGSSIGNFNPAECDRLLTAINLALNPGDYFLLGIDLQKPREILESAYNDSQGVTAAFNLNMLQHLNHRFQGNFNSNTFQHQAIYNPTLEQIEMYLVSQTAQKITLTDLDLTINLEPKEAILTEISRKFNLPQMEQYLNQYNFNLLKSYTDSQEWFGLLLSQKN